MTSRERVMASVAHKEPDYLPMDLGSNVSTGISGMAYGNLKKYLGMTEGHTRIYDVVQQVALPEDQVLDLIGADVLDIARTYNTKDEDWYDVTLSNGNTAQWPSWFKPEKLPDGSYNVYDIEKTLIARMPNKGMCFDQMYFPYKEDYPDSYEDLDRQMGKVLWSAMAHSPWDHQRDFATEDEFYSDMRRRCLELRNSTDKALMITCGCNLFEWGTFLRRMENFLMDTYADPENVIALNEQLMERHLHMLEKVCDAVGDVVDILRFGDDLGMDTGMFMSLEKYRTLFKPFHTKLNAYVHEHSGMKTFLHSCGSIYPVIPELIEAGYDILNPVQTSARDMDPARLKKEYGRDITFWGGGCNTRRILNLGSPQEVYDYSSRMIDIFYKDGGFIFNTEHNILPDVPPENIMAMYKAVENARK
ncbi:uroporphyrinogen decarboxylase family protein [Murimonas intestini]|uniref:Uroporphyrinogen decarboxylase n=1 Tax=Murimonas intestini TaxID=1337051 RepID=A0AB73T4S3_9FIRM|nr:uroporphyrinogen decarboxylase family protein [Murimonas intestini]MCR1840609.1 methyltransferase [Murimonas intestini]MCR1865338.1 methyltransferase [Murimonas intestini]MCR1882951.1 methyltransferase [Murimonas intestini]